MPRVRLYDMPQIIHSPKRKNARLQAGQVSTAGNSFRQICGKLLIPPVTGETVPADLREVIDPPRDREAAALLERE